jgi:hypothetical protein
MSLVCWQISFLKLVMNCALLHSALARSWRVMRSQRHALMTSMPISIHLQPQFLTSLLLFFKPSIPPIRFASHSARLLSQSHTKFYGICLDTPVSEQADRTCKRQVNCKTCKRFNYFSILLKEILFYCSTSDNIWMFIKITYWIFRNQVTFWIVRNLFWILRSIIELSEFLHQVTCKKCSELSEFLGSTKTCRRVLNFQQGQDATLLEVYIWKFMHQITFWTNWTFGNQVSFWTFRSQVSFWIVRNQVLTFEFLGQSLNFLIFCIK